MALDDSSTDLILHYGTKQDHPWHKFTNAAKGRRHWRSSAPFTGLVNLYVLGPKGARLDDPQSWRARCLYGG